MTAAVELRPWRDDDADAQGVADLTRRYFAPDAPWDAAEARAQLAADALGGGRHVRLAVRDGRLVGVGGYVVAPPWLFLWPVAAEDGEVAGALIDAALAVAARPPVERARVSVRAVEPGKQAAVIARGFTRSIDFLEHVWTPGTATAPPATPAHGRAPGSQAAGSLACRRSVELTAADRAAMHATHDLAFAGLANTAPTTDADFAHLLDGAAAWPAATAGWFAPDGTCAAFVIGLRHADHGVVEAVGTHPAWRGRGLGAAALAHVQAVTIDDRLAELRAMIASDNPASLALHAAAGFAGRARKELWDLVLPR